MARSGHSPPRHYTYTSRIVRCGAGCEDRARHTRATVPVRIVARTVAKHEGRTGHGNGKAHDTRRGQQQARNKERRTNKRIKKAK